MPHPPDIRRLEPWANGHDTLARRSRRDVHTVVVHRIEVSQEDPAFGDHPADVVRFFREHPIGVAATGGQMPYPILIDPRGQITQTLPLGCISPHAVRHNPVSIGVACLGDFRRFAPPPEQFRALVRLCAGLLGELEPPAQPAEALFGHDELAGASRDPDKICPGALLPMGELRGAVARALRGEIPPTGLVW